MAGKAKIAIVWRGGLADRGQPLPQSSRLYPMSQALQAQGFAVASIVYCEEASAEIRNELLTCDGVLVWVDPLTDGRDRADLDATLRHVAAAGVWVSAHPDVILKIGTKEVLYTTRHLGWGGDTALYRGAADLRREFPDRLRRSGTRVLKQYRGNGGQGVWKVALQDHSTVRLQEATHRDGTAAEMTLERFLSQCEAYFAGDGRLIDQAFCPRIVDGMVRCYMSGAELIGFARQYPAGYGQGIRAEETFGLPAAKTMLAAGEPQYANLRASLERDWIPQMRQALDIAADALPAIWDADFLFGPRTPDGADSFVLCEINASCVTPFPPAAPARIAAVARALARR